MNESAQNENMEGEKPHEPFEHVAVVVPRLSSFTEVSAEQVYSLFFFAESMMTGVVYLNMLQEWLMPQPKQNVHNLIFEHDSAPPHFHNKVSLYRDEELPNLRTRYGGHIDYSPSCPYQQISL
jgi:hypothetical protein